MSAVYRRYQQEADDAITNELKISNTCCCFMFCATGKSLVMKNCEAFKNKELLVYVFPSLILIEQFTRDYLNMVEDNVLKICSNSDSTTEEILIKNFVEQKQNKIICITYQSYNILINILERLRIKIDVCVFDEAHHVVGPTYQKHIFENEVCKKTVFFTATPKNDNGIVMYDRNSFDVGICGKIVYEYSYLQGVIEGYVKPFEIRVDLYTENTNYSVFESISRAILKSGNNRVLTFHSYVNTDRDTSVENFVNEEDFKRIFRKIQQNEFPEKTNYKNINFKKMVSSMLQTDRIKLLQKFDSTLDDEIVIISSCDTIGEGVDTKKANMCVFVDPKSSIVKIIQNIGRIIRKIFGETNTNSTVLIPCCINKDKYLECDGNKEKCDERIRQDINEGGDFNCILNVLSALKQTDNDLFEMCLNYTTQFSLAELTNNFLQQGYKLEEPIGNGTLVETLNELLDVEINYDDYHLLDDCAVIKQVAEENNVCIEVHTNLLDNSIKKYNERIDTEVIRLYCNDDDDDDDDDKLYRPIVKKCGTKRNQSDEMILPPNRNNRVNMQVYTNPDIKVLWNISEDFDITRDICSCIIDSEVINCGVIEIWETRLEETKHFIDENKRKPKDNKQKPKSNFEVNEKQLNKWVSHQTENYKKQQQSMKDEIKRNKWEEFLKEYKEYFKTDDEKWNQKLEQITHFINENDKLPSSSSKLKLEKSLAGWLHHNIRRPIYSRRIIWEEFVSKYKEHFETNEEFWNKTLEETKYFIDKNKKRPNSHSINPDEKKLGNWIICQNSTYELNKMINVSRRIKWAEFVSKYKEHFETNDEKWNKTLEETKQFIDENKKQPSKSSTNLNEKKLGNWIGIQNTNYKNKKKSMKNEITRNIWDAFLEEYKEYFETDDEKWYKNLEETKQFIDENDKLPSSSSKLKLEKFLGSWISDQKKITKKNKMNSDRLHKWEEFLEEYKEHFETNEKLWNKTLEATKQFIDENKKQPSKSSINPYEQKLGYWINRQKTHYKKPEKIMKNETIRNLWKEFEEQYLNSSPISIISKIEAPVKEEQVLIESKNKHKTKKSINLPNKITENIEVVTKKKLKRKRKENEISELHQKYKTMTSNNLSNLFNTEPKLWDDYHKLAEQNDTTFQEDDIPRNQIISRLKKKNTRPNTTKRVVDMGCGKAQISKAFENDTRYEFINYDLISSGVTIEQCDISHTPLIDNSVDICILSMAMWCSNKSDYIKEAYRILESDGRLYIIEPTRRWSEKDVNGNLINGQEGLKLKTLLEQNGFQIINQNIEKFCLFDCLKNECIL